MSLRINTNMASLNTLRNVERASDNFGRSIERLASGMRINRGADDPAGLIRSEDLRAQITGLEQAIANSQDATNLIKTAEGALEEVHTLLRSMRQLAVASGNTGTNDLTALQANQNQIRSAIDSINRIAMQTQFGTKKLLDGTSGVRALVTDPNQISGIFVGGSVLGSVSGASGEYRIASGAVTLDVTTAATKANISSAALNTGTTLASLVSDAVGSTNVPGTLVINGVSFTTDGSETLGSFLDRINAASSVTGVVAQFNDSTRVVEFRAVEYGSQHNFTISTSRANFFFASAGNQTVSAGVDATATATFSVYLANGSTATATVAFTGGRSQGDSGLRLTDEKGNVITLREAGNDASLTPGAVANTSASQLEFQIGGNAGQKAFFGINDMTAYQLGTTASTTFGSLAEIDVTVNATEALKVIDAAIAQVSKLRGDMGAFQKNILESNMRSLAVAKENLTASESAIRDTNFAEEISRFTKFQILQQAGMSVLGQANSAPQAVLQLIR
ncbi:MAG: flagellin [Fimbriimonadales bacterium]